MRHLQDTRFLYFSQAEVVKSAEHPGASIEADGGWIFTLSQSDPGAWKCHGRRYALCSSPQFFMLCSPSALAPFHFVSRGLWHQGGKATAALCRQCLKVSKLRLGELTLTKERQLRIISVLIPHL